MEMLRRRVRKYSDRLKSSQKIMGLEKIIIQSENCGMGGELVEGAGFVDEGIDAVRGEAFKRITTSVRCGARFEGFKTVDFRYGFLNGRGGE
jgi:hypothetical protein